MSDRRPVGQFTGTHVLAEFAGVAPALLDDAAGIQIALRRSLDSAGATVCEMIARRFQPHGVTVLALLSESHASVHTYPEFGTLFCDVFTCGEAADPAFAVDLLAVELAARSTTISTVNRGKSYAASDSAH